MVNATRAAALVWVGGLLALATAFAPAAPPTTAPAPGASLPAAPDHLPESPEPDPTLARVRAHLEAGDDHRALREARRFVEAHEWGRERDVAWLVMGLLHREAGRHNLASEAFTRVRSAGGPLEHFGAYHEAEQDLARGREWVAIKECQAYRKKWPKGMHAGACQRLIATAHARLGNDHSARRAADEYDEEHDEAPIREQIELQLAMWRLEHEPEAAVPSLQALAVNHDAPLTGRVAEELLDELAADGVEGAALPDDTRALQLRAVSLRDVKRKDDAWELFSELARRGADDPDLSGWVDEQAERFGWRTHRWDFLADWYAEEYEATGDPEHAWSRYRVLGRGGRFAEASEYGLQMQEKHAGTRDWRRREEYLGQTLMLAGRYDDARSQFDTLAARGGWRGRRASFFGAFSALMAGDLDDAVARFDKIVERNRSYVVESHYWRSRALRSLEREDEARADEQVVLETDPWSWYALLVRQQDDDLPEHAPFRRSGHWVGAPPSPPAEPPTHPLAEARPAPWEAHPPVQPTLREPAVGFARLLWSPVTLPPPAEPASVITRYDDVEPPPSYQPSPWLDPHDARRVLYRFGERHRSRYPELRAIHDLASAGLYDLSGPMMSQWYEEWRADYRRGYSRARQVRGMRADDWRSLFLAARDHHHAARFTYGLWEEVDDPGLVDDAQRLAYPLAHDRTVWAASREHGIDPYMVMGLMRQESTYNAMAVSRVGARGAMQIMPRTGHLLADLGHDTDFTAGDLEDPLLSVEYGITYLGLLMDRFEGVYPLAIASYNGGPFNVSAWLRGTGSDMPMDVFVEHIPFRETRDYVKKVSAGYAGYVALYAPEGSAIVLPPTPRDDHPEIVDF